MSDEQTTIYPAITAEEAKELLHRTAWKRETPSGGCCEACGREKLSIDMIQHAFRGPFGADWSLAGALHEVDRAVELKFKRTLFGVALVAIDPDGKPTLFDWATLEKFEGLKIGGFT